jgi:S-DNA-T family DNA segregation ATPase FtsK/SpoIIIE
MNQTLVIEHVSGPAVTSSVVLAAGRHILGRSPDCAVQIADPEVEPHHLLIEVGAVEATAMQLAGRFPVLVDGLPLGGRVVELGEAARLIELGSSRVRVGRLPIRAAAVESALRTIEVPGDPTRLMVVRPPRCAIERTWAPIRVPDALRPAPAPEPVSHGQLVTSAIALVVAVVMAVVVGQAMFAMFALMGAVASLGSWAVTWWRRRAQRLRAERAASLGHERLLVELAERSRALRARHLSDTALVGSIFEAVRTDRLWARRPEHTDAFTVTIGWGEVARHIELACSDDGPPGEHLVEAARTAALLEDMPVPVDLGAGSESVLAVTGPVAAAVVRALVMQIAVSTGPADWSLLVVAADPERYRWCRLLPHLVPGGLLGGDDQQAFADARSHLGGGASDRVVVLTDLPELLAHRGAPVRALLASGRPVTVIVETPAAAVLPAVCGSALHTGPRAMARWHPRLGASDTDWGSGRVRVCGISESAAAGLAACLAAYVDPEDPRIATGAVPDQVTMEELAGVPTDVGGVIEAWQAGGIDPAPAAVIGRSADGDVEIDLVRDGPHGLVAGTTGSGKSELLRTLVTALATRVSPEHLNFVLVDYKGGATFDACAELPHTVGLVTDLDEGLAARALVSLEAELHRRERILRSRRAVDLAAYRAVADASPLPRLVVVIDEFAALAKELPGFLSALVGIAQRGRSLGVHLLLATQRPAGVIDDAIRANTDLRLALRLNDVADALDVVGVADPARISREVPGRATLRLGPDQVVSFQAATCTVPGPEVTALRRAVDAVVAAARQLELPAPYRPWLPPLDDLTAVGEGIGVVDDPAGQRRLILQRPPTGHLALIGSIGAGTTTALVALGGEVLAQGAITYVIDARGDQALEVLNGPQSARHAGSAVVRAHERERVDRIISAMAAELDRRRTVAEPIEGLPNWVLLVDGLTALRQGLDDAPLATSLGLLDRILSEGPAVGMLMIATVEPESSGAATVLARFAERWVFHLDDRSLAPMYGVSTALVPPAVPGRLVVASSRLAAQVYPPQPDRAPTGGALQHPRVLPEVVPACQLNGEASCSGASAPGLLRLPVGLGYRDLQPVGLELASGEHLLVVGPGRSGRSSLLVRLATAWRSAHPGGRLSVVQPGTTATRSATRIATRSATASPTGILGEVFAVGELSAGDGPHLVIVDDAERVADVDGRLLALVESGAPDLLVVAAGRAEALRSSYGHWTAAVRRSRAGFVMTASSELDGDLFGAAIPRRCPLPPRPGLAWMIGPGGPELVQVAMDRVATRADPTRPAPTTRW